jgi:lipid-A-disaccharide synthase
VNLLAKEEVYPEFLTDRDPSTGVAEAVIGFLTDPQRRKYLIDRLNELCDEVARPGACAAAARFILDMPRKPDSSAG